MAEVKRGSPEEVEAQRKARAEYNKLKRPAAGTAINNGSVEKAKKEGALAGLKKLREVMK